MWLLAADGRPGCPRRSLHDPDARAGEDIIEYAGELGGAVPDEEPERAGPGGEVDDQIAGLLGSPSAAQSRCLPSPVLVYPRRWMVTPAHAVTRPPSLAV